MLEFRELGKSGIMVSAIGLGTWQWGSREWGWGRFYGKKDLLDAFEMAVEVGINFIDTAEVYGGGKSEEIVGEAIHGHREGVVIATKVWPLNASYSRVLRAADRSLRRLRIDVIDLYQVHWPNPLVPIRNTMKAMKKLVRDGKVRCIGVSNFSQKRMAAAQHTLAPMELTSNQVRYNLLDRRIEVDVLPYSQKEKITIIAYSPLAQALLTGRYTVKDRPRSLVQKTNSKFSTRNLTRLAEFSRIVAEIAQARGRTPSQLVLNWLIRNENVVAIPGVKGPQHVVDNAGATDWRLTDDETKRLETAVVQVRFDRIGGIANILRALTRSL
jgi:aryl-alcohol dehydrogenase-like predicted oxidoreductase